MEILKSKLGGDNSNIFLLVRLGVGVSPKVTHPYLVTRQLAAAFRLSSGFVGAGFLFGKCAQTAL